MLRASAALLFAVSIAAAVRAEVTPGEILVAEMNCVACHDVPPEAKARLASRPSPVLSATRATPQWLRDFLTDPQKVKPETLMPDMLHGVPADQKPEIVEALVHFIVGTQQPAAAGEVGASPAKIQAGQALYHSTGCVQCHAPQELPASRANDAEARAELDQLQSTAVPMAGPAIARKYRVPDLAAFLRDPLKSRPGGRMPSMKLSPEEAEAIAAYLLRDQTPGGAVSTLPGLQYEYYERDFPELPEFDRLTPTATGVAETPSLKQAARKGSYALRWRGNLHVPKDGRYKFYLASDDGARLYLDGRLLIDNGGIHPKQERTTELDLKAGAHAFTLTYFDGGGETALDLKWRGPGLEKGFIPAAAFSHDGKPMVPLGDAPWKLDPAKAAAGARHFQAFQCAKCHEVPQRNPVADATPPIRPFTRMRPRVPGGCLSPAPQPQQPKYKLTDRQRTVILALLQNQAVLQAPLTDQQQIRRTMTTLNCYACHSRDKRGGVDGLRREYLASVGEVDLGDEGRVPPTLENVGAKLQPAWMRAVLTEGAGVRPYMATRMPQFGKANVERLVDRFERADKREDEREQLNNYTEGAATLAKHGRKLVGTAGGLSCIACHNFAGNKSLGVPALDLATTGQRLKWDWFRRYLLDPQSLRPGTRMPAFWPGGVAVNKDVLKGNTEQQIAAVWLYLARKNFTDLPAGLVQGKQELVAEHEAAIYRNFIDGGGTRAIGVGYPEKANLCFDANELRLTMIWQGPFIDAARHQTGRGAGFEKPLGTNVLKLVKGPAFAVLENEDAPWPDLKPPALDPPFLGYRLDDRQRPAFRYRIAGFEVEDYPVAVPGEVDALFRRTITVKGSSPPAGRLYFRAALGKIAPQGSDYLVDDRLRIRFQDAKPLLRPQGNQSELLVPVELHNGSATFVEELIW